MARGRAEGRRTPRRGGGGGDDGDTNRWLATYGDAVTLLMAFFVMLYAVSQIDAQKFEAFISGLAAPFGNEAGQGVLDAHASIVGEQGSQAKPNESRPGDVAVPPPGVAIPMPGPTERPEDEEKATDADDDEQLARIQAGIVDALRRQGLPTDVAAFRRDERGLVVTIASDDVLFELGSAEISALGSRIVATVARVLTGYPNNIHVEGHTDNTPLRRPGYTNWNLSTDRAVTVLTALYERHGISPQRLSAVGYGEFRPRYPNDTPGHRASNRRVDILIVAQRGTNG